MKAITTKTIRVYFEDKGQDLIHLDIDVFANGEQGIIENVCQSAHPIERGMLLHKAVLMTDIETGKVFVYADPSKGFAIFSAGVRIRNIEEITE